MRTPIFDNLHRERCVKQCDACQGMGWPLGWFTCVANDPMCCDY